MMRTDDGRGAEGIPGGNLERREIVPRTEPAAPVFKARFLARDEANDAVDDALGAIKGMRDDVLGWIQAVGEARTEALGGGDSAKADALMGYLDRLRLALADIESLQGRVVNYGGSVEKEPIPRSEAEQGAYDEAMRRYAAAAKRTADEAEARRDGAQMRFLAAERTAAKKEA